MVVAALSLSVSPNSREGEWCPHGAAPGFFQVRPPDPVPPGGFHGALQGGQDHPALLLPAGQGSSRGSPDPIPPLQPRNSQDSKVLSPWGGGGLIPLMDLGSRSSWECPAGTSRDIPGTAFPPGASQHGMGEDVGGASVPCHHPCHRPCHHSLVTTS